MSISTNAHSGVVRRERNGAAMVLTICRPEAGNSISLATAEELSAGLKMAETEPGLRAVIVTGEGGKFFCTGGDVKAYRSIEDAGALETTFGRVRDLLDEMEAHRLPILAAIEGYALGGGLEMALACDQRFASSKSRLGLPQAKLGLIPGWNGVARLIETVGRPRAIRLLYTAAPIGAAEALDIGLVDEVADSGMALAAALAFVERLSETAPLGVEGAKAACMAALRRTNLESREASCKIFERLWFTADHREAEAAFAEKRSPKFSGR